MCFRWALFSSLQALVREGAGTVGYSLPGSSALDRYRRSAAKILGFHEPGEGLKLAADRSFFERPE
jgi:hypothetical protein